MSVPDANWCRSNPEQAAREIENLMIDRDRQKQALEGVMDLIDEGKLVRNIENDGSLVWAQEQLPLIMKLKAALQALGRIET